jgi:hypothetical protein
MCDSVYYVYAYLREDRSPYYIGKGKNNRAYNKSHTVNLPEDLSRIVFLAKELDESSAHALEKEYILKYGRVDNGTGILRNLTDGGEGTSGRIHDEKTKTKIKHKLAGRKRTKSSIQKQKEVMRGRTPWNKGLKCDGTTRAAKPPNMTGYKWINNGTEQTKLAPTKELPEGWVYGRIDIKGANNPMRKKNGIQS